MPERVMQDEQYVRGTTESSPIERTMPEPTRVESVPSEQLWRAAILAARQAALSAAELRRAFEATPPTSDE